MTSCVGLSVDGHIFDAGAHVASLTTARVSTVPSLLGRQEDSRGLRRSIRW